MARVLTRGLFASVTPLIEAMGVDGSSVPAHTPRAGTLLTLVTLTGCAAVLPSPRRPRKRRSERSRSRRKQRRSRLGCPDNPRGFAPRRTRAARRGLCEEGQRPAHRGRQAPALNFTQTRCMGRAPRHLLPAGEACRVLAEQRHAHLNRGDRALSLACVADRAISDRRSAGALNVTSAGSGGRRMS